MSTQTRPETYLVADLFCGADGSSTGAKRAIEESGGTMELVAINHWNTAIATHQANHPTARHLVEDVSIVDPETVVEEGSLDLLMASPECKFYSRARGGRPVHDRGRMNPWAIHNWLTKLDVRCVLVENVPEFVDWGPLTKEGKPDKSRRGEHFQAWFLAFHNLGYEAQWRMLNAADYGDATTRTRFFLIARKDGVPVRWPEPSHAKSDTPMFGGKQPWRGAKEIIDWSLEGRSILDDPKYVAKPLSVNTHRRIARGLARYGGVLAPLYIRLLDLPDEQEPVSDGLSEPEMSFILNRNGDNGSNRCHSVEEPMPTATTRGAGYLVQPVATRFMVANRNHNAPKSLDEPVPTVTTAYGGGSFIIEADCRPFMLGQQGGSTPRSTDDPVPTIAADGAISLLRPTIIRYQGTSHAQDVEAPLTTITKCNKHALIQATLVEYYGNSDAADVNQPLPSITAKARHALANPILIHVNHGNTAPEGGPENHRVRSVEEPLPSITTHRGLGLAQPVLVETGHTANVDNRPAPAPKPFLTPNFGERGSQEPRTHDIEQPIPAVTGKGAGNLVVPSLVGPSMEEPVGEELAKAGIDPRRLILVDGQPYLLDIRFRMLQNPELARAMGFEDEETPYEFHGNKSEVTKQIGNAVPVNLAAALVKATQAP